MDRKTSINQEPQQQKKKTDESLGTDTNEMEDRLLRLENGEDEKEHSESNTEKKNENV